MGIYHNEEYSAIQCSGAITADLSHYHSEKIDGLSVETDQNLIGINISIRDWFTVDFTQDLAVFYSAWQSYDATAQG